MKNTENQFLKLFPNNKEEVIEMYSIEKHGFPAASASALMRDMTFQCTGNNTIETG